MAYIDADKVLEELENNAPMNWTDGDAEIQEQRDYEAFKHLIESQPTADVVPRAEYDEVVAKLECLLCFATGGKLSKHTYLLEVMQSAVEDYVLKSLADDMDDYTRRMFGKIEKIIDKHYNRHIFGVEDLSDEEKEAVMNFSGDITYDLDELKKNAWEISRERKMGGNDL